MFGPDPGFLDALLDGVPRAAVERDELVLPDGFHATDTGNADRLVQAADGRIRFVHAWQKFIVWCDGRWVTDVGSVLVTEMAKLVSRNLFRLAGELSDREERKRLLAFASRSESAAAIANMVTLARGVPGVLVDHDQLDAKPWLLNVLNGTVDIRTGRLRPHDPDDLLTMQAPVVFDPEATASTWLQCVATWQPDPEIRGLLQRAVGSAITGHPVEALFVNCGSGGNGKSKFFGAITDVLGPFAVTPHKSLIVASKHEGHPTAVASLFRARMLVVPETSQNDKLDEEMVKGITGGDRLRARRMREDEWSFAPTWSTFMHTNYRPKIVGTDEGIWRRVKLIPWAVTIPAAERDEHLARKLRAEASGILNWLIAGALEWQQRGLDEPESVRVATAEYRNESDTVAAFLTEAELLIDSSLDITASELMQLHGGWFAGSGISGREAGHYQLVTAHLTSAGATKAKSRSRGGWYWKGVGRAG